jgi:hypothetical protein
MCFCAIFVFQCESTTRAHYFVENPLFLLPMSLIALRRFYAVGFARIRSKGRYNYNGRVHCTTELRTNNLGMPHPKTWPRFATI